LDLRLEVPSYANPTYGPIPYVDATAVFHGESGEIDVFLVNRSETEQVKLSLELSGFASAYRLVEHIALSHADRKAVNDEAHPDHVFPRRIVVPGGIVCENQDDLDAGPLTWNMFRLQAVVQNGDDRTGL
jgi:alpha-N-arabinofuranosidase